MNKKNRRSAVRLMIVAGGLTAAAPALGAGAAITCSGKPQTPVQTGAITCNGKPQVAGQNVGTNLGFFCNMAPKANGTPSNAAQGTNAGFYCNMAPKTDNASSETSKPKPKPQ